MTSYKTIKAEMLRQVDLDEGIIIDVRTQMEHAEKHLTFGHALMPLDQLNPTDFMLNHGLDKDANVYVLCRSGKRAAQAADKFVLEGYRSVYVIEGGIISCEDCGHDLQGHTANANTPSDPSKKPLSLERQVRIAAGAIAASGALMGLFFSPVFTLIPLFVGCGLMFAGITDRCGMALVLTKTPWNRIKAEQA